MTQGSAPGGGLAATADPGSAPAAMGGAVLRGSLWMLLNTVATRGASFAAQIALGLLLSKRDFGIYALALSVSSLAAVLKDGGVKQLLVQRQREYSRLLGPVFWMAGAFNLLTGLLVVLLGIPLARLYHAPILVVMMLVIGVAQPLSTPGAVLATRLQIDMRFREASLIMTVSALVRYVGAVVLAFLHFGALSFVLPVPILAILEWALAWWYTREKPWRFAPLVREWPSMFRDTRWVIAGTLGIAGLNLGSNVVIGFFVPLVVVGAYFFAFQIVVQIGVILSANVVQVLFAAFAKIADDLERKRAAALRSLRQIAMLAGPMCLGLAATFSPLERLIWKGKWADAADAVELIGLFYPAMIAASVALAVLQARGLFRAWGVSLLAMAGATLVSAALGAAVHGSAGGVALYSGVGGMLAAVTVTCWGLRQIGVGPAAVIGAIAPAWLLSILSAATAMDVDAYLLEHWPPVFRLVVACAVFGGVFGVTARVLLADHLREGLAAAPARLRPLASSLLRLS